jgi:hypothetical protein
MDGLLGRLIAVIDDAKRSVQTSLTRCLVLFNLFFDFGAVSLQVSGRDPCIMEMPPFVINFLGRNLHTRRMRLRTKWRTYVASSSVL